MNDEANSPGPDSYESLLTNEQRAERQAFLDGISRPQDPNIINLFFAQGTEEATALAERIDESRPLIFGPLRNGEHVRVLLGYWPKDMVQRLAAAVRFPLYPFLLHTWYTRSYDEVAVAFPPEPLGDDKAEVAELLRMLEISPGVPAARTVSMRLKDGRILELTRIPESALGSQEARRAYRAARTYITPANTAYPPEVRELLDRLIRFPDVESTLRLRAEHPTADELRFMLPFMQRRYMKIPGFHPAAVVAAAASHMLATPWEDAPHTSFKRPHLQTLRWHQSGGLDQWYSSQQPVRFIGRDLAMSLMLTSIPDDIPLSEIPFPFRSVALVLPEGVGTGDETYAAILISLLARGTSLHNLPVFQEFVDCAGPTDPLTEDTIVISLIGDCPGGVVVHTTSFPRLQTWGESYARRIQESMLQENDESTSEPWKYSVHADEFDTDNVYGVFTAARVTQVDRLNRLAMSALFTMSQCPELCDQGRLIRKASHHGKREIPELWHPAFIGANYKMPGLQPGRSGHASPRVHVRRGHWRQQRHGPNWGQIKLLWIKTVVVNPGGTAAADTPA